MPCAWQRRVDAASLWSRLFTWQAGVNWAGAARAAKAWASLPFFLVPCPLILLPFLCRLLQTMYNDGPRVSWGGGIMGPKSQAVMKKREKALAKDARA